MSKINTDDTHHLFYNKRRIFKFGTEKTGLFIFNSIACSAQKVVVLEYSNNFTKTITLENRSCVNDTRTLYLVAEKNSLNRITITSLVSSAQSVRKIIV